jgi:hypothetical protein
MLKRRSTFFGNQIEKIDPVRKPKQEEIKEVIKRFEGEKYAKMSMMGQLEANADMKFIEVTAQGYTLVVVSFKSGTKYKLFV